MTTANEATRKTSWAALWAMAWPLLLTMLANAGVSLLDTWVAGRFDATSQAAVALTGQLMMLVGATTMAWSMGCQALVSRAVGAGDWDEAGRVAKQTLVLGGSLTLALLVPLYVLAPWFFGALGATPEVAAAGTGYLRWLLLALVPMDLAILINAVFRAQGDMRAYLRANVADNLTWAALSLGLGYAAGWGLTGLTVAFVAGRSVGLLVAWAQFRGSRVYPHLPPGHLLDYDRMRRIATIGLPGGVEIVVRNLGMAALLGILGRLPHATQTLAAYSIGFRIEAIAFLPVFALNLAVATLVGQALGAGQAGAARQVTVRFAWVGVGVMAACGLAFWFGAEAMAQAFSPDPEVRAIAASYLRIAAISEPGLGLAIVLGGTFQGAGDTRPSLWITLGANIGIRLPLAYVLAVGLGWGADGVAWAMTTSVFVQATAALAYYRAGRWQRHAV